MRNIDYFSRPFTDNLCTKPNNRPDMTEHANQLAIEVGALFDADMLIEPRIERCGFGFLVIGVDGINRSFYDGHRAQGEIERKILHWLLKRRRRV